MRRFKNHINRIKEIRKVLGLSQKDFGKRIGITKSAVNSIESNLNGLTDRNIQSICLEFNVDYLYLTTGTGDMFQQENAVIALI